MEQSSTVSARHNSNMQLAQKHQRASSAKFRISMQRQKRASGVITANQDHPGNDKTLTFAQSAVDFIQKRRKDSSDVISCVVEDDTAQQSMATAAKT